MSVKSLEEERQAILDRMKARREDYRRMLTGGDSLANLPLAPHIDTAGIHAHGYMPGQHHAVSDIFPRSAITRTVMEHPFLVALGVAAVVAIGPRRILRGAISGSTAVAALTGRNQSNVDLLGRLLTMAGAYVQGRNK